MSDILLVSGRATVERQRSVGWRGVLFIIDTTFNRARPESARTQPSVSPHASHKGSQGKLSTHTQTHRGRPAERGALQSRVVCVRFIAIGHKMKGIHDRGNAMVKGFQSTDVMVNTERKMGKRRKEREGRGREREKHREISHKYRKSESKRKPKKKETKK